MQTEGWCFFPWFFSICPGSIIIDNIYSNNFSNKNFSYFWHLISILSSNLIVLLPLLPNLQPPLHSFSYILIPDPTFSPKLYLILMRQFLQLTFDSLITLASALLDILPVLPTYPTWAFQGLCSTFLFCSKASSSPYFHL